MRPVHLYLLSVLAFGGVLFSINDASAILLPPPPTVFPVEGDTLQMTCNIPGIGESSVAMVTAGNGIAPGPSFPVIVTCPGADCPNGPAIAGQYARWDFTFDYTSGGATPRTALVQVAADVTIEATNPSATVVNVGEEIFLNGNLNDFDSKWLRFAPATDPFPVSYYTKPNFTPRIEGASAKKGLINVGKCKLAGAGSRFGDPAEATTVSSDLQAGPCSFRKVTDGRGCTLSIALTSGNPGICTISNETLNLSGNVSNPLSAGTKCADIQVSFDGSCRVCYPSPSGTLVCVNNNSVTSCPR